MSWFDLIPAGRDAVQDRARGLALGVPYGGDRILCRVLGDYKVVVPNWDLSVGTHLVADGFWEMWVSLYLAGLVRAGWRVADVGANLGYYTLILADRVGPTGMVHAFEPNPDIMPFLARNVRLNGFEERVKTYPLAVSSRAGEATLRFRHDEPGSATVREGTAHPFLGESRPVPLTTLDDAVEEPLHFVKVDAEGFDYEVWRGARRHRERNHGLVFLIEHYSVQLGPDPEREYLEEAEAEGYTFASVEGQGNLRPTTSREILAEPGRAWNLVLRKG